MTSLSVIIPTCDRPGFLREALNSVRAQTYRQRIGQVIVSENGLSDLSAAVTRDFSDLPLTYVSQRPPQAPLLHLKAIWPHVRLPQVAFLHDDDWWAPDHIASALALLDRAPDCAAVFSSFYETAGPAFPAQLPVGKPWRVWAASGCNFSEPTIILDSVSTTLCCLLDANFHYSTLVGRAEAVRDAYEKVVEAGNTYDNDRLFGIFLSKHGSIGYLTRPDVFVRIHSQQDCMTQENRNAGWAKKADTTRWLLKAEPEKIAEAAEKFNKTSESLSSDLLERLTVDMGASQLMALVDDCRLHLRPRIQAPAPKPDQHRGATWFLKQLTPPVVLAIGRRFRNYFAA